ncbi:hypothetical protein M3J09_011977 [Ascochyta lentis]
MRRILTEPFFGLLHGPLVGTAAMARILGSTSPKTVYSQNHTRSLSFAVVVPACINGGTVAAASVHLSSLAVPARWRYHESPARGSLAMLSSANAVSGAWGCIRSFRPSSLPGGGASRARTSLA